MVVEINLLREFIIGSWLQVQSRTFGFLFLAQFLWHFLLTLGLEQVGVLVFEIHWVRYFIGSRFLLVTHNIGRSNVPFLKSFEVLSVADQQVVGQASLVELDIIQIVFLFLLHEQVLLCFLRDVVVMHRVPFVELGLVLSYARSYWFLQLQN